MQLSIKLSCLKMLYDFILTAGLDKNLIYIKCENFILYTLDFKRERLRETTYVKTICESDSFLWSITDPCSCSEKSSTPV